MPASKQNILRLFVKILVRVSFDASTSHVTFCGEATALIQQGFNHSIVTQAYPNLVIFKLIIT